MLEYSGIQVVLNRPSRFDLKYGKLISGTVAEFFNTQFARFGISREQLHICTAAHFRECGMVPREGTKGLLVLGDEAQRMFETGTTLGEQRGSPFFYQELPCISSFAPQDCYDQKDYEGTYHGPSEDAEDVDDKNFNKGHGITSRKNYKFWLKKDIAKLCRIVATGMRKYAEVEPVILPSIESIERDLLSGVYKGHYLHIDIETDPDTLDITVLTYMIEDRVSGKFLTPLMTIPLRKYDYTCHYSSPHRIWRSLVCAFRDMIVVTHNGHQYDLFVFTYRYRIPFPRNNWDTMIGHHRCFPEVEKSLGHCVSLYTDCRFHKNDGIFRPFNSAQEYKLWMYNATDVLTMAYIRQEQELYARKNGMLQSILEANESIVVYLTETFTGIRRNSDKAEEVSSTCDKRAEALQRILNILVGRELNANSPKQVQAYIFNSKTDGGLGLEPYAYGKVSKKTGKASPKADEKTILRLQVRHGIASLAVLLEIRKEKKLSSSLKINHWNPFGRCYTAEELVDEPEEESDEETQPDVEV